MGSVRNLHCADHSIEVHKANRQDKPAKLAKSGRAANSRGDDPTKYVNVDLNRDRAANSRSDDFTKYVNVNDVDPNRGRAANSRGDDLTKYVDIDSTVVGRNKGRNHNSGRSLSVMIEVTPSTIIRQNPLLLKVNPSLVTSFGSFRNYGLFTQRKSN